MHRWFFGFFVLFMALGYFVLSGMIHIAAEAIKIAAYGSFALAVLFLLGGFFAYSKVKATFSS